MPDSRPRPPLDAWDGIVIAIADFAAMVAAAVNATSAERRVARSLSIAATVARRCARCGRAGAACSFNAKATRSVHIHRARISHHTTTIDRSCFTPFAHRAVAPTASASAEPQPLIQPSFRPRSIHSPIASPRRRRVVASSRRRVASFDVPRGEQWFERSSRTSSSSSSSSSSCVATVASVTRAHRPRPRDRPSIRIFPRTRSRAWSSHDRSMSPLTLEIRVTRRSRSTTDRSSGARRRGDLDENENGTSTRSRSRGSERV